MNIKNLAAFITVAKFGSFTLAAQEMYVTQQALSRQIMVLEQELDTVLFARGKTLQLTASGEKCLVEARKIVERYERLVRLAGSEQKGLSGSLSIGYLVGLRMDVIAPVLRRFSRRNPNVKIELLAGVASELLMGFKEGRLDVIFLGKNSIKELKDAKKFDVFKNPLKIIVPDDHPLAEREIISLSELADEPFVMLERKSGPDSVDHQIELCRNSGFSPQVEYEVKSPGELKMLISMGKGVGFLSKLDGSTNIGVKLIDLEGEENDDYYNLACVYREDEARAEVLDYIEAVRMSVL